MAGIFGNANTTFEPITTDGNRVLGKLTDPAGDTEIVWVPDSTFRQLSGDEVDDEVDLFVSK